MMIDMIIIDDRCVVCGTEKKLVRHSIVPHSYRKHFSVEYKSRSSHDIVLVCQTCLQRISQLDNIFRNRLSVKYNAPMEGIGSKYIVDVNLLNAKKYAKALLSKNAIPQEKLNQYKVFIPYTSINIHHIN